MLFGHLSQTVCYTSVEAHAGVATSSGREYSVYDMSSKEDDGVHFEGTGVLVLDRPRGTAYVSLSERADAGAAQEWVENLGYKQLVTFKSFGANAHPVYHTNVMMAVGTGVAIVCGASVKDEKERQHLMVRTAGDCASNMLFYTSSIKTYKINVIIETGGCSGHTMHAACCA